MQKIFVAVFLFTLIGQEVISQACHANGESCDDHEPCCKGAGVCRTEDSFGNAFCRCATDSWWSSCSQNIECCNGYCNTRGYCGCISSGLYCTAGRSDECCGSSSGIKTCTAAWPIHHECY